MLTFILIFPHQQCDYGKQQLLAQSDRRANFWSTHTQPNKHARLSEYALANKLNIYFMIRKHRENDRHIHKEPLKNCFCRLHQICISDTFLVGTCLFLIWLKWCLMMLLATSVASASLESSSGQQKPVGALKKGVDAKWIEQYYHILIRQKLFCRNTEALFEFRFNCLLDTPCTWRWKWKIEIQSQWSVLKALAYRNVL